MKYAKDYLLSIIIPIYNVEKFIGETLDSIVIWSDNRNDIEIIIVDDGSPDSSATIAYDYQLNHNNIRLIKQENKGLGGARNTGIENAKGKYVWFVDSDDWVVTENLPKMIEILEKEYPQAMAICANDMTLNNMAVQRYNFDGLPIWLPGSSMLTTGRFSFCAPFTIYKRDYLNEKMLRFKEHLFHEDNEFTPRAYYGINHLLLFNSPLYTVRQNPNSITRSDNFKKNFDLVRVAKSLDDFKKTTVKERDIQNSFDYFICVALNKALSNSSEMSRHDSAIFYNLINDNKYLFKSYCHSTKMKHRIQGLLFSLIPLNPMPVYNKVMNPIGKINRITIVT